MSKKTKSRRGNPAGQTVASKTSAGSAQASRAPSGGGRTEADAVVERVMSSLWAGIAAGEPLRAELETATCMGIPRVTGQLDPDETEKFISTVLVERRSAGRRPTARRCSGCS